MLASVGASVPVVIVAVTSRSSVCRSGLAWLSTCVSIGIVSSHCDGDHGPGSCRYCDDESVESAEGYNVTGVVPCDK